MGLPIEDAVDAYSVSPCRDRADRIRCKRDILEYIKDGIEPKHRVAQAVVEGQHEVTQVQDAHRTLQEVAGEWWRDETLTFKRIQEMQEMDDYLKTTERDERLRAFNIAFQNADAMEIDEAEEKLSECFSIKSESTVEDYAK